MNNVRTIPYREPIAEFCFGQAKCMVFTYPPGDGRGELWIAKHASMRPTISYELISKGIIEIQEPNGNTLQITGVPAAGASRTAFINRIVGMIA